MTVAAVMAAAVAYVVLVAVGRMGPGARRPLTHRPTMAAAAGLALLAVVGLVANDSSLAVPTTMLIVAAPVVALRVLRPPGGTGDQPPPAVAAGRAGTPGPTRPRVPVPAVDGGRA